MTVPNDADFLWRLPDERDLALEAFGAWLDLAAEGGGGYAAADHCGAYIAFWTGPAPHDPGEPST